MFQSISVFVSMVLILGLFKLHSAGALDCSAQARCDFEPPLAWATDGNNCKVFFNSCHLRNHNCERQGRGENILTDTTQDKCFQYCRPGCTKERNPVCTVNSGVAVRFENPCLWAQEMCRKQEDLKEQKPVLYNKTEFLGIVGRKTSKK